MTDFPSNLNVFMISRKKSAEIKIHREGQMDVHAPLATTSSLARVNLVDTGTIEFPIQNRLEKFFDRAHLSAKEGFVIGTKVPIEQQKQTLTF